MRKTHYLDFDSEIIGTTGLECAWRFLFCITSRGVVTSIRHIIDILLHALKKLVIQKYTGTTMQNALNQICFYSTDNMFMIDID